MPAIYGPEGPELTALLPVLTVTVTALIVLVADWFLPDDDPRPPAALSTVGLVAAGLLVWRAWGGPDVDAFARTVTLPGGALATASLLSADAFALFVQATLLAAAVLTVLMSVDYVRRRGIARAEYFVLVLLATAGMMLLCLARDLIVLFLALETFSIALYVLAGFVRGDRPSQEAALKYFVLGAFAAGFLLYGIALLYLVSGATDLAIIGTAELGTMGYLGLALLLVGLGFKVAIVPFHQWKPDVYEGAPLTVTAFMAAATKVAAFAALIRVMWTAFGAAAEVWVPLLSLLAVLSMVLGNLGALVQADLKRMLGYSAIAHAGYVLVAVVVGGPEGTAAALFYLLIYAFMTLGAFAVLAALGPVASAGGDGRDATNLNELAGLGRRHPGLALALTVFLVALTGLPPTAGFVGKWYLFQAAVGAGFTWLAVAVVLNSVLSAFYYLRPVVIAYTAEPADERELAVPAASAVVVAVLAVVVGLGVVLSSPLIRVARAAAASGPTGTQSATTGGEAGDGTSVFVAPPALDRDPKDHSTTP